MKKEKRATPSLKKTIMQKAFFLMARNGVKEISMRQIAQACDVTKPAIYYYFKDKEDLCYQLIKNRLEKYDNMLEEISRSTDLKGTLLFLFSKYAYDFRNKDVLYFMMHVNSFVMGDDNLKKKFLKLKNRSTQLIRGILENARRQGHITKRKEEIGFHLIMATLAHFIINSDHGFVKFGPSYAKDMTQAILTAMCYKQEK